MQDPYSVLGVQASATFDEVTVAYRKLAKKYHPDLNPGNKAAEEKMQQINAAYDKIKNGETGGAKYERADGTYGPQERPEQRGYTYRGDDPFGGFGFGGFEDFSELFGQMFGGNWQQQGQSRPGDSPMVRQIKVYLQNRQYQDAERVLSQMQNKNAEWYYLSALTSAGLGNRMSAMTYAKEAVRLEPNNFEYHQLINQLERGSSAYRQTGQQRGYNMQTMGNGLLSMLIMQLICCFCCRR